MGFEIIEISEDRPEVMVVEMKRKPVLAVAMENPRISQYPENARNTTTLSFVAWALNMLGVNHKEGGTGHHKAVYEFVNTSLQGYTYEELKEAILMFLRGEFNGKNILVAQQLNAVVLGKIMHAFDDLKKEKLNVYLRLRAKQRGLLEAKKYQLTPDQKKEKILSGIKRCFNNYLIDNRIIEGHVWIYDFLLEQKIINPTSDEKKIVYKGVKDSHKQKSRTAVQSISDYNKIVLEIESNTIQAVVIESKEVLLKQYFEKMVIRFGGKALDELLKLIK
ncbi:hypothetical protein [Tenacibaculum finnmarkense]|uniref:hypothetical protein n=1 Tax=Tenacibaculum finnmarkense TaxID=2781243 RepID=UPI0020797291|nr:hypothetical protein [Tenacibaculum finnmarkense]MCM8906807.1 hypothetical protein [Tenacibaculum finnmarkense genomovar finnmarkense]